MLAVIFSETGGVFACWFMLICHLELHHQTLQRIGKIAPLGTKDLSALSILKAEVSNLVWNRTWMTWQKTKLCSVIHCEASINLRIAVQAKSRLFNILWCTNVASVYTGFVYWIKQSVLPCVMTVLLVLLYTSLDCRCTKSASSADNACTGYLSNLTISVLGFESNPTYFIYIFLYFLIKTIRQLATPVELWNSTSQRFDRVSHCT